MPEPRPPSEIAQEVLGFARDDSLAGRVMVMWPGELGHMIDPGLVL
jgi:hypothetical protein